MSLRSYIRILSLAAVAVPTVVLTGCAGMSGTAPLSVTSNAATMKGNLHGGNQPISGSTIQIFSAGTTGYGSASTLFATTTSASDGYGSFSFSKQNSDAGHPTGIYNASGNVWGCPTTGDPQMYVIAKGGSTTGTSSPANSAAAFIVALGKCSTISSSTFVDLNEVTTAATLAALQQFFNPSTESFGYNGTLQSIAAFNNGVLTIANLADIGSGYAVTSKTLTGANSTVSGTTVTMTPEAGKINTIANVLTACVNTTSNTSDPCTTLFANAVPPANSNSTSQPGSTYATAQDTIQAAYYMLVNPTGGQDPSKVANLYNLTTAFAPFQPQLTAAPTDWTVGIKYDAGTSACSGTASGKFIYYAYMVRADANGNIWIASNGSSPNVDNISVVGPNGVPMGCVTPSATAGVGFTGLTIDTVGNVWAASHSVAGIYEINPNTFAATTWTESGVTPWAIEADGSGNVFYTVASAAVRKFTAAASASSATASTAVGTASNASPNFMTIDAGGNIWVPDTGSATNKLYETYPDPSATTSGGYSTFVAGTSGNVQAQIAVDASGRIWTTQTTPANTVTVFTPTLYGSPATVTASGAGVAGVSTPRGVALDGAGNAWVPNGVSGGHNVAELTQNLNALSPSGGYVKADTFANTMRSVAVDATGNVWFGTNATTVDQITEIVGAGVPVITPLSAALAAGTPATKP